MNDVRIRGLAELQAALDSLPAKIEQNIMRGALRAGAVVLRDEAKAGVPKQSGDLRDSIRVSVRAKRGTVTSRVIAGNKDAFYAHMVEMGTAAHIIKGPSTLGGRVLSNIEHPGARKNPFLRPALDNNATAAIERAREYIRDRLSLKHGIDVPGPGNESDE